MSNLQERAPIGFVQGRDVMITPEWFRNLSQAIDSISITSGLTTTQITALTQVSSLSASLAALTAQIAALTARVNALEGGFQS